MTLLPPLVYPSRLLSSMMVKRWRVFTALQIAEGQRGGLGAADVENGFRPPYEDLTGVGYSRSVRYKVLPFRILEHTADVGFEAFGGTREEVFANAALALTDLMVDLKAIQASEETPLEVRGPDPESVLVNWLSEILYLFDAEGWVFRDFRVTRLGNDSLSALAQGEKFQPSRHHVKVLVKAVTYHQLALEETPRGWRAQVYVDI